MEELERRLREARRLEQAESSKGRAPAGVPAPEPVPSPAPPAAPPTVEWRPTVQRPTPPAAPTSPPRATPGRAPAVERTPLQPSGMGDRDDDWEIDVEDAEWEAVEAEMARRPAGREAGPERRGLEAQPPGLPAPIQAFVKGGHPWQAAFVVKEVLGPPRSLSRKYVPKHPFMPRDP